MSVKYFLFLRLQSGSEVKRRAKLNFLSEPGQAGISSPDTRLSTTPGYLREWYSWTQLTRRGAGEQENVFESQQRFFLLL